MAHLESVVVAMLVPTLMSLGLAASATQQPGPPANSGSPQDVDVDNERPSVVRPDAASFASQTALIQQYCVRCHNDRVKVGGMTLASFDVAKADESAPLAEKMIRRLRAGMMPPPGARRPTRADINALVRALEGRVDQVASVRPNPGRRPFQRLNQPEYNRSVRDLLALDVDVSAFLPPDVTSGDGFDNIADEQVLSPTLLQGYLRAADEVSGLAIGDRNAQPRQVTYSVPITASQMHHVEGAPIGTRGGISAVHVFPADGEYTIQLQLFGGPNGEFYGMQPAIGREQIDVSVEGLRVALLDINPNMEESDPDGLGGLVPFRAQIQAGPRRVSAAFIRTGDGPIDDLIAPIDYLLGDANAGVGVTGITAPAHLRSLTITGPYNITGVSETPSRRKIFGCYPVTATEEAACAEEIVEHLATQAYRGNLADDDLADLMRFYEQGRNAADFESGIQWALQAILANPRFVFRLERTPPVPPGQTYRISDVELASRLSFFLWGTIPDEELRNAAVEGRLRNPGVLERQVRRMLADSRVEALATRFAAQWLRLKELEQFRPDYMLFPHWDQTLVESLQRETELFFESLVAEDRSVLELITADYTFANERIARHYGLPKLAGSEFRRVSLPDENRRGILGHGSILMLTSIADRTSPVIRGKWVLEVLLGLAPPPPPPNVPALEETKGVRAARPLSVRERLEEHRANPACASCHRLIDPIGLALENFDAVGAWRFKDGDALINPTGELYDGTKIEGPASLRQALLRHSDVLILSFAEHLMTYALGRPVEYYDMPAVRAIVQEAGRNGNRMSAFVLGIVNSAAFQMSRTERTPPQGL